MTNIKEQFRACGIHNVHEILTKFGEPGKDVAIWYVTPEPRACRCSHACVYSPSHNTDPQAAWYNYGRMTFVGKRKESMPKALEWASKKYGISEWASAGIDSSKIPKSVADKAKAWLKEYQKLIPG